MPLIDRRAALKLTAAASVCSLVLPDLDLAADDVALPFGNEYSYLESLTTGQWWKSGPTAKKTKVKLGGESAAPSMDVPRDQVVAFAIYLQHSHVLKLSAQLYPLKPGESRDVHLELRRGGEWQRPSTTQVLYPGWDAHFRIEDWDATKDVPYRVRHGDDAMFEGLIRRDPIDKNSIVVGNLSCNSSKTVGERTEIIRNLKVHDPDLLFFSGDQHYRHTEHTAGWIEFGLQFREIMRDRPTICIPDDHDVGHGNLWGDSGKQSFTEGDADGGYRFPVAYVNQVQRQQSWHLPDAVDPAPVDRDIQVYFTRLILGGVDFAILEDRKFKTGPDGKIPQMGPRPDHVNDPSYDPKTIDLPGLQMLGSRQEKFLEKWGQDWSGVSMKAALSQTAFCGAVHMHGSRNNRLLADLDCNGWPQTPRNRALCLLRKAWAVHLCGDQHLAVVVKHGIDEFGDGPYGFTSPAIVNTIYGRWWHPLDEKPGPNAVPDSPLPWTGDFKDGLGNRISMMAYANPENFQNQLKRADGYGIARFDKKQLTITFECWPRFCDVTQGDKEQFPGWPITVAMEANDGRQVVGWLPELIFKELVDPVVQVIEQSSGEVVYTTRIKGNRFQPRVYSPGTHTVKYGPDGLGSSIGSYLEPKEKSQAGQMTI
jgi:hypothetical protein